ncbi:hypothetical protein PAHAL_9G496400 [Panicum hallii]|uniref:Uncharacterized protein n=1 Tax=Panicum hallii TaxID=206008 RepID=A0A2T8I578_9POAL|nr:hypothetical protein PAHAL_9G496400 [Panicum hallii]
MDTPGVLELSWIRIAYERKRNGAAVSERRWPWVPAGFGAEKNRLVALHHPFHRRHSIRATCALPFPDFPLQVAEAGPDRRWTRGFFSVAWRARIRSVRCDINQVHSPDGAFRRRRSSGAGCGGVGGHGAEKRRGRTRRRWSRGKSHGWRRNERLVPARLRK